MKISELPMQVIAAIGAAHPLESTWKEKEVDSFLDSELEEVKKVLIGLNNNNDSFWVFNATDNIPSSEPDTFDNIVDLVTNWPKRYERQGYYRTNEMEMIGPEEVYLQIKFAEK